MSIRYRGGFNLRALNDRVHAAIPAAVRTAAEHVAEVSAQQVPIEEGTLLRSQRITAPDDHSAGIEYGTPYARYQHEKTELRHEHGNAKFLEIPMVTERQTAIDIMANGIRRAVQS